MQQMEGASPLLLLSLLFLAILFLSFPFKQHVNHLSPDCISRDEVCEVLKLLILIIKGVHTHAQRTDKLRHSQWPFLKPLLPKRRQHKLTGLLDRTS